MAYVQKLRKSYFPFSFLLRSAPYQGKGALKAENCRIMDGRILKMKAAEEWTDIDSESAILHGHSYKKDDGTHQKFTVFLDNGYYVMRAIDSDKTLITPTLAEAKEVAFTGTVTFTNGSAAVSAVGGLFTTELTVGDLIYLDAEYANIGQIKSISNNTNLVLEEVYAGAGGAGIGMRSSPHFTSDITSFEQIGAVLFIGNDETTLPLLMWNGSVLAATANAPTGIKFLTRDKNRLVAGGERKTEFSGDAIATSNDWDAEAGASGEGEYKTELIAPKAGISAGSGIIIVGEIGSDAQKVIPNNASDEISADTSIDGFSSPELGVDSPNKICAAGGFVYKLNAEGIHRMNSFNGESVNLTETGEIGRKWKNYDTTNGIIIYDIANKWVIACVTLGARNDTLIGIDVSKEELPIFTVPDSYYSSLFISGNELFAGSSSDGKIYKPFAVTRSRIQYSHEWDGIDLPVTEKKIKKFSIFANVHPLSSFILNLYIDGSDTPFYSVTLSTSDSERKMRDGEWNGYVFEAGNIELNTLGVDYMKENRARTKFSTIRFEIIEDSQYDFEILDAVIEYKSKSKLIREKAMNRV